MKKLFFGATCAALIFFTALNAEIKAQQTESPKYKRALGANVGSIVGVNFKQFVARNGALDFVFGYDIPKDGVMLTAVYQHHFRMVDDLYVYVGGGVNLGVGDFNHFVFGIDPTVGFEYKFEASPVVLALDYTPQLNIVSSFDWKVLALKVRFVL